MHRFVRRGLVALCVVAGAAALAYASGRLMAVSSGFPNLSGFSSAEVYVYDENSPEGRVEPLSATEEEALREVLSTIRPVWPRVDADDLVRQTGWHGEMFLLTLGDGEVVAVKDALQHVLVRRADQISRTKAWRASDSSLAALHSLYEEFVAGRTTNAPSE